MMEMEKRKVYVQVSFEIRRNGKAHTGWITGQGFRRFNQAGKAQGDAEGPEARRRHVP